MISFVEGTLDSVETDHIVVNVFGIGYMIYSANPYLFQDQMGQPVKVYTYQHVREDAIQLYGFQTKQERLLFSQLLNVSGIGPKGALAILASGQPEKVVEAVEKENESFLVKFPGVGKKTARQMILDLQGKLDDFSASITEGMLTQQNELAAQPDEDDESQLDEAMDALRALGYTEREIKKVYPQLQSLSLRTDEYIKKALQLMLQQ
ncbi:Holliday junction branch migration protein RuvA [Texcoconibacillus texcoconensis]|uniref:Holliday junction branch migration complex subunit RuvA n=1 Tax=Texcoconibacillus texcoconensis TaxID=1095777 RepID=A0A840QPB1_9BACI|nr:Holliday junction branch migration protein RuvA [Texcoconibacillus texcoconensis]MBB5173214.1 Holliday junction DNA helicase RuvA [Texcoconibacillus texcoconensis]